MDQAVELESYRWSGPPIATDTIITNQFSIQSAFFKVINATEINFRVKSAAKLDHKNIQIYILTYLLMFM